MTNSSTSVLVVVRTAGASQHGGFPPRFRRLELLVLSPKPYNKPYHSLLEKQQAGSLYLTYSLHCSSFFWSNQIFFIRILNGNPKKELLRRL